MISESLLLAERLRLLISYDKETGIFTWKVRPSNCVHVGAVAGFLDIFGYWLIRIDGRLFRGHRLAWLYMTGAWPVAQIDHINLDKSDNRFCNLREATPSQNMANIRPYKTNTSGLKGSEWHKRQKKWRSQISVNGKWSHLGTFATREEAHAAYCVAAREAFDEFARSE